MSTRVIPAVPAKRMCKCDGCGIEAETESVIPFGWNRISARDKTKPIQQPIYGDYGGWPPTADGETLYEGDYCDTCSERMVQHVNARHPSSLSLKLERLKSLRNQCDDKRMEETDPYYRGYWHGKANAIETLISEVTA